ncbi:hypothetical protein B0H15DRAFT_944231 [Mycena belliarum]|uniref:Uncharacterized protein n=1 Tax=Mycena belliarum TaxID=1033014 RepID=A0AAD6XSZ0_9AGAR|nr:hypothetical protein B0H15DRAFT_944231 [Mycena belliae]
MHLVPTLIHALTTATLAAAVTPTRRSLPLSLNPTPQDLSNVTTGVSMRAPQALTNAKRLALGLPLLRPHRRITAPPTSSPLPPVPQRCNIRAVGTDNTDFGYLSPLWNGFGEYGMFQASPDGALELAFSYSPGSPSQISITAANGPSAMYSFFGAIVGFASTSNDFGLGSYHYAYLGGTTQTAAGAPPSSDGDNSFSAATGISKDIESAIWSYDPVTHALTAQWVNTDGAAPATHIVYANDSNKALAITGDVVAFQDTFGAPYPELLFTCVPPTPVTTTY